MSSSESDGEVPTEIEPNEPDEDVTFESLVSTFLDGTATDQLSRVFVLSWFKPVLT